MSLINDALKKARLDADRQEAQERGEVYTTAPSHVPPRKRIGLPGLLAVGTLIAAGVLVTQIPRLTAPPVDEAGGAAGEAGETTGEADPSVTQTSAARPATAAAQAARRDAEPSLDSAQLRGSPGPRSEAPVVAPPPERAMGTADRLGETRRRSTRSPARTLDDPVGSTSLEPSPERPRNRPGRQSRQGPARRIPPRPSSQPPQTERAPIDSVDGKSFLKKVRMPGGASLELSGIAWSDTHPVAVISGSIVEAGDFVEGFKVTKIEPNSVELQGDDATFSIRLR